jgi:glycosyltransferase involved in cell wall biosynthesis
MKLAIIGPSEKYASGIANYTWRLGIELNCIPILYGDMLPLFLFPGRERVGASCTKIAYRRTPTYLDWYNPLTWIRAIREIRRTDLFIVEWWSCSVAHMLLFICLLSGRRFVIEAHEVLDPLEQKSVLLNVYGRIARRILFSKASAIVVHNHTDLSLISDKYKNVSVIPHAVYDQFDKSKPKEWTGAFNVMFFGLIREYKGIDVLIKAFNQLEHTDKRLIIVGENWDKIPIPEQIDIYYTNKYVSDNETEWFFQQADVLVLPYTRGSASGVAAIGIHYGLPIIASRVDGIYEQLHDYEGVMWIDPGDELALLDWLRTVYDHRDRRYEVPERLQWKTIKRQWEELLNGNWTYGN